MKTNGILFHLNFILSQQLQTSENRFALAYHLTSEALENETYTLLYLRVCVISFGYISVFPLEESSWARDG